MKAKDINTLIYHYSRFNAYQDLQEILETPINETVDITNKKNFKLFDLAIIHDFVEVLNILLHYFRKVTFQNNTEAIKASESKFQDLLEGTLNASDGIPTRIIDKIQKYLEEDKNIELNGLPHAISSIQKESLQKKLSEETDSQVQVEVIRATQLKITPEQSKLDKLKSALKCSGRGYITHEDSIYLTEENTQQLLKAYQLEETSNHLSNITLHNEDDSKENTHTKIKEGDEDSKENSAQNTTNFKNSNLQTSETEYTSFESKTIDTSQVLPSELDIIGICQGENHES